MAQAPRRAIDAPPQVSDSTGGLEDEERSSDPHAAAQIPEKDANPRAEKLRKRREMPKRARALDRRRLGQIDTHVTAQQFKRLHCLNTWGRLERDKWTRVFEEFVRSVLRVPESDVRYWVKRVDNRVGRRSY
jgi:hypothetical protein